MPAIFRRQKKPLRFLTNLRAKSLKAFCEKYKPKYAVRTSMSDYREQEWMTNIPLYNIDRIKEYLEQ